MKPMALERVDWVAEILGVRKHRVYELAREGLIPCVRLGRQVRFDPQTIAEFVRCGGFTLPRSSRRDGDEGTA